MKIKEINGQKFSRDSFKDYKLRVSVEIVDKGYGNHRFDIYTTITSVDDVYEALIDMVSDNVMTYSIRSHSTREQDERAGKFIDDVLNNI